MWNKLKSKTAETLLETIVSLLIAVLSITLLTTGVMAAAKIQNMTNEADMAYKSELEAAETSGGIGTYGNVSIIFDDNSMSSETVTVNIYGGENYASYRKE